MRVFFQQFVLMLSMCMAVSLIACAEIAPTPLVVRQVTVTPQPTPSPTPRMGTMEDSYIPELGPFPPKPIPARPPNINPLTGLATDPVLLQRRPLLVRIGNDERVRTSLWQAGMSSADLVFEELIDQLGSQYINTRMSAVFLGSDPPLVGPVRSGRLVNLQLVPMLGGALANAGASDGVRWIFGQTSMVNLDEYYNMPAYCYNQPHGYIGRLYSTVPRLREWLTQKGLETTVPLHGFEFADKAPAGQRVDSIGLSEAPWPKWATVEWRYDPSTQKYLRSVTGSPHIDNSYKITAKWGNAADCVAAGGETRTRVSASNVIVLYAKHESTTIIEDSNNALSVYINLVGQGDVDVFRDGIQIRGKWMRNSVQEFFAIVDESGKIIPLKPGNSWFEIVPTGYKLNN
jgi:hypothetical protein